MATTTFRRCKYNEQGQSGHLQSGKGRWNYVLAGDADDDCYGDDNE